MERIGTANCPKCGIIDIFNPQQIVVYVGKGLAPPYVSISCSICNETFINRVTWDSAYVFDYMGCEVVGFSRRMSPPIKESEINLFMKKFDNYLEHFLNLVEEEGEA